MNIEGLWTIVFAGIQGPPFRGGVVLVNRRILGADDVHTYDGHYQLVGNKFNAKVTVRQYQEGFNVMNRNRPFEIELSGNVVKKDEINAAGAVVGDAESKLHVVMKKLVDY
jgi:hypothetical protein